MKEKVLEMRNLCKNMGGQTILNSISLDIYKKEILGLIGANGAGKTTLMKIIAGLAKPDSGCVECHIPGKDKIGVLVDLPAAYGWLSGYQNLKILASMYKNVTKEDLSDIINLVGLDKVIHKKYQTFSAGMRQRLGIAMALLNKPKLIILDEPTNGLDFDGICEMRALLRKLVEKEDCTVVLSSHILSEMEKICSRAVFLKKGEIVDIVAEEFIRSKGLEAKYKELVR